MDIVKKLVCFSVLPVLAACGGGGTGTGAGVAGLSTEFAALNSDLDLFPLTSEENLPSGSATYRGVASFNTSDLDSIPSNVTDPTVLLETLEGYYGALPVDVSFSENSLSGDVQNFVSFDGTSASGAIDISDGGITAATNPELGDGFAATASGNIDGRAYTFDVGGNFHDDNAEALSITFNSTGANDAVGTGLAAR